MRNIETRSGKIFEFLQNWSTSSILILFATGRCLSKIFRSYGLIPTKIISISLFILFNLTTLLCAHYSKFLCAPHHLLKYILLLHATSLTFSNLYKLYHRSRCIRRILLFYQPCTRLRNIFHPFTCIFLIHASN